MKSWLLASLLFTLVLPAFAAPKEVPKGSELRAGLFDLARSNVEDEAGQAVKFAGSLKQLGEWAFFLGTIVDESGAGIPVGEGESADTAILWKIVDSEWQMITHAVGITDVAYASWPEDFGAPEALIFPEG
jgi:hypothetical protein